MAKLTYFRLISVLLFITVLLVTTVQNGHYTIVFSFVMLMLAMFPFFLRFEMKKTDARIVVLISILAAIAAIGRIPFAALPSIQPTSFVIIVTGLAFGAETGFMVGATAALVSNFFLGQGPWTPWQMFSWGMMGFTAGMLKGSVLMQYQAGRLAFGFAWGFLFGWIMNLWYIIGFLLEDFNWKLIVTSIATSFYFDLMHALSNVFFLALFCKSWLKILNRFKKKVSVKLE